MKVPKTVSMRIVGGPEDAPFEWDGETQQESLVEALIINVEDGLAHFVVTRVLEDPRGNIVRGYGHGDGLCTADTHNSWSAEFPDDPRSLASISEFAYPTDIPKNLDKVELETDVSELSAGDMVHIHELLLWGKAQGRRVGHTVFEVSRLETNIGSLEEFFARSANLKPRIAAQLLRTFIKREQLEMLAQNRISPNEPTRPFANPEDCVIGQNGRDSEFEVFRSRNVFGAGPVKDHFVDVVAVAAPDYHLEVGGQQNHTVSGRHLFTPNIIPFGEGSDDDPLYEVEIKIHSDSVMCPAVGEQKVIVLIDGVAYDALKNTEESSRYFEKPGHDVVMTGFRAVGQTADTYEITEEQSKVLYDRREAEHAIVMGIIMDAVEDGSFYDPKLDLKPLDAEAERRIMAMRAESTEANRIISGIVGSEPICAISSGAPLLIPKSMLDSIEIILPSVG